MSLPSRGSQGFSLVELLLAFSLGVGLCGLMLQTVLSESQISHRLSRQLREQQQARRALNLLRSDLQRATTVSTTTMEPACNLSGRAVFVHLETPQGAITYSVGRAAEPIWRGQVLMRCGGAFGLDGSPSVGQPINRVILDALASGGARALDQGRGILRVELRQSLALPGRAPRELRHQRLLPLPVALWGVSASLPES